MANYRIGCTIPGASFMPEGEAGLSRGALDVIRAGCGAIVGAGFDYAEAGVGAVMELSDADVASLAGEGLPIEAANSFIPPKFKIVEQGACDSGSPLYAYVDEAMARMSAIGIRVAVFGSGGARHIPDTMTRREGLDLIAVFLRMCAGLGRKYGVTVAIEPLRALECNAINKTSEAIALADEIGDENVAYLADAFHMAHGGEPADTLRGASRLPVHIHVSEPPDRRYPGADGGEYLKSFAESLRVTNYAARVSVECGFSDFAREVRLAYDFMNRYF